MDNIISLIERLGADSELRFNAVANLAKHAPESVAVEEAVTNGDIEKLELMLNARNKIVCMIFPVEEPKEQPDQPDDDKPNETSTRIAV